MSDDPIRAALEAAAREVSSGVLTWDEGDEPDVWPVHREIAAAAIAAFLRGLPDQYSRGGAGFWDAIPPEEETRLWLAAAVEKAARDA